MIDLNGVSQRLRLFVHKYRTNVLEAIDKDKKIS